jgi:hypothetical protein
VQLKDFRFPIKEQEQQVLQMMVDLITYEQFAKEIADRGEPWNKPEYLELEKVYLLIQSLFTVTFRSTPLRW